MEAALPSGKRPAEDPKLDDDGAVKKKPRKTTIRRRPGSAGQVIHFDDINAVSMLNLKNYENEDEITDVNSLPFKSSILVTNVSTTTLRFWSRLPDATIDKNILRLVAGTSFMGRSLGGCRMLIRNSYQELAEKVFRAVTADRPFSVLVTGTPGIGKTTFAYYMCYLIWQRNPDAVIVYEFAEPSVTRFLLKERLATRGATDSYTFELGSPDSWYIVDGTTPSFAAEAKTLLVSSPEVSVFNKWKKQQRTVRYFMPTWTWEELETLYHDSYENMTSAFDPNIKFTMDLLQHRFLKFGGVPRTVLFKWDLGELEEDLEEALGRSDLQKTLDAVGQAGIQSGVSDALMHLMVDESYTRSHYEPASSYVSKSIIDYLARKNRDALQRFIMASEDIPKLGGLRGKLFESAVHPLLARGGPFEIRALDGSESRSQVTFGQLDSQHFRDVSEIVDSKYYVPLSETFGAIDSLGPSVGMFQITIKKDHKVKAAELMKLEKCVKKPHLYFVVPWELFEVCPKQSYLGTDGRKLTNLPTFVKGIKQFALGIKLGV
ncbi:hypothetical protein SpCBS45565_g07758 [Spizellomyces sp. 'palustris']|nr:hypothetical protein SpCBS45565_g07758 [Spizellomyces sp. 'palustris']